MEKCATCKWWERDVIDGVCFGGIPRPQFIKQEEDEEGQIYTPSYVMCWPRTNPEHRCPAYEKV